MDEIQVIVTAADQYIFTFLDRQRDLTVTTDFEIVTAVREAQPNSAAAVDDQRARRKGVREHRHQRDGIKRRGQNRPAGGEGIGGGTGRR